MKKDLIKYISKEAFVFSLSLGLNLTLVKSGIVYILNILFHSTPKAHGFVSLPLKSFYVCFNLRVKDENTNIKGSQDIIDLNILLDKDNKGEACNDQDEERIVRLKKEYPEAFERKDNASPGEILGEVKDYIEDVSKEHLKVAKWKQDSEKYSRPVDYGLDKAIEESIKKDVRNDNPDKVLKALEEFQPRNFLEEDSKNRLIWKNTHPPIPETDWNNTKQTTVDKNKPEPNLAISDSSPLTQSYYAQPSVPLFSPQVDSSASSSTAKRKFEDDNSSTQPAKALKEGTTDTPSNLEKLPVKKESPVDFVTEQMECEMPSYMDPED